MKRTVALRPAARADLKSIAIYSRQNWGKQTAQEYVSRLIRSLERIDDLPALVRDAGVGKAGLKKLVVGSHILFFHIGREKIDVVRILHGSMDPQRHL